MARRPGRRGTLAALLLASMGPPGCGRPGGRPAPALPPPPSPTPPPSSPFSPGYAADLDAELQRAQMLRLDATGELFDVEFQGDQAGLRELLSPDPERWGLLTQRLPRLRAFLEWCGQGGDPRTLPAGLRDQLAGCGRRYANQRIPDPFHPFLQARPDVAMDPARLAALPWVAERERIARAPPRGWLAAAVEAAVACLEGQARRARELEVAVGAQRAGRVPGDFPADLRVQLAFVGDSGAYGLEQLAERCAITPQGRIAFAAWIAEPRAALERFLVALGRTLRLEPEQRDRAASLAFLQLISTSPLWHSHLAYQDPTWLLGGPPDSPAAWLVTAMCRRYADGVRRERFLQGGASEAANVEILVRAAGPPLDTPEAARRALFALQELSRIGLDTGRLEALAKAWERHRSLVLETLEPTAWQLRANLVRAATQAGSALAIAPEDLRRMVEAVDAAGRAVPDLRGVPWEQVRRRLEPSRK